MAQYIDKDTLVAEIKERIETYNKGYANGDDRRANALEVLLNDIDTLEVKDPYEHLIQYSSREDGIKAHAEDYSWNIESELFQQLAPEQQKLWRKEIEQAYISGGYCGLNLQKDRRYDDTPKVKEMDWEKEWKEFLKDGNIGFKEVAKHFYELGLKTQHSSINIPNIDDIFEEGGIDPDSTWAKIFRESYYMALEKLKA